MKKNFWGIITLLFLATSCRAIGRITPTVAAQPCTDLCIDSITTLVDPGGNIDWSPDGKLLAYDEPDINNFTNTWVMKPDGSDKKCLTCNNATAPTPYHLGNPTWHPNMQWLVVQGVDENFYKTFPSRDDDYKKRIMDVGVGIGNELWATTADGSKFFKLTNVWQESKFEGGILHPHFSPNGKLLAWAQRVSKAQDDPSGAWAIKLADFVVSNNVPHLENIRTYQTGKGPQKLYETHTFSPDGSLLLFTSNSDGQDKWGYDLYTLNINTGKSAQLTYTPKEWDEHAHFSPDGKKIIWISSMNAGSTSGLLKTELWSMNADGSNQKQVTSFNDKNSSMFMPDRYGVVPADISWSPDGTQFALYVIVNQNAQTEYSMPGKVVLVKLKPR